MTRQLKVFQPVIDFLQAWIVADPNAASLFPKDPFLQRVVLTILQRKCGIQITNLSAEKQPNFYDSLQILLQNPSLKSKKRTEENNKFVFKYALKILRLRFRHERPDVKPSELDSEFFSYYFG